MGRLFEREEPLELLEGMLDDARNGRGRVALVRGEAGIGKTSVARQFVEGIDDQAHVLWGSCDDLATPIPLGAVRDIAIQETSLSASLNGDDRNAVFLDVLELLSRSLRPTVMVIEDIHWADDTTLDLIRFLGRRIENTHGLLILTYRDGEDPGDEGLRVLLGGLPHGVMNRIVLQPLTIEAVTAMLPDAVDAEDIFRLTGGNPFFVSEIASTLDSTVPPSIRESVGARVTRLSAETKRVLNVLSVSPTGLELEVVTKLDGDARRAIEDGERVGILEVDGGWVRFRHELARRAVEGELSEITRRELNGELLRALEASDAGLMRRAHHAREAGDVEAMLRVLPEAAKRSASLASSTEAVALLEALEPYMDRLDLEDRADLYELWAWQADLADQENSLDLAGTAVALRRQVGDPQALGRCLNTAGRIGVTKVSPMGEVYLSEAMEVLAPFGGADLAMSYAIEASRRGILPDFPGSIEYGEKALALSDGSPSAAQVRALNSIGVAKAYTSYPDGIEELERSFRVAGEIGAYLEQVRAAGNLNVLHYSARYPERGEYWVRAAQDVLSRVDIPTMEHWIKISLAWDLDARGQWDEALEVIQEVLEWPELPPRFSINCLTLLAVIQMRRGAPDAASRLEDLLNTAVESEDFMTILSAASPYAEWAWIRGPEVDIPEAAMESVREAWEREMAREASEVSLWLYLAGRLDSFPEDAPEPYCFLGGGDWEAAAAFYGERGIKYEEAIALSFGDVQARLRSLALLDELRAIPVAAKVRAALRAEGVRGIPRGPYRGRRESPIGLTPRQTEILGLIGEGRSNSEIADHLFLSVRTVEHHVAAIMTTLGASTRGEAVRLAADDSAAS